MMPLKVEVYTASREKHWDEFVDNSVNGTFMHSRRFLSYHPARKFDDCSLLFVDKDRIVAVFPAAEAAGGALKSHPGATYGGLVVGERTTVRDLTDVLSHLTSFARQRGFASIWMRHPEGVFRKSLCGELDSALFAAGFAVVGRELSSAYDLCQPGAILATFSKGAKALVSRAINAGIVAGEADHYDLYWKVLRANLLVRYDTEPTHSLDEILRLKQILGPRVRLVTATQNGGVLAGILMFIMNNQAAHIMYSAQDYSLENSGALNLAVYEAIGLAQSLGLKYLNYGISTVPGTAGRELNVGLHQYKRHCGFRGTVRDLLEIQL